MGGCIRRQPDGQNQSRTRLDGGTDARGWTDGQTSFSLIAGHGILPNQKIASKKKRALCNVIAFLAATKLLYTSVRPSTYPSVYGHFAVSSILAYYE